MEQSHKGKISVKNVIINHISSEHLRNIYYATVFLKLILLLHCYYGDNVKYGLLSKCLFQKSKRTWSLKKKIHGNNKFLLKIIYVK